MKMWRMIILFGMLLMSTLVLAKPAQSIDSDMTQNGDSLGQFISQNDLLDKLTKTGAAVTTKASALVVQALSLIGIPYKWGGTNAETGFDCSGFVQAVYQQTLGLVLPRQAKQQARETEKIPKTALKPGDLVFFNTRHKAYSHVGIYIGDDKFIHSPTSGSDVRIDSMANNYWSKRFDGARRVDMMGYSVESQVDDSSMQE